MEQQKGSLVAVGTGINVVSQTTIGARSHIINADVIYMAVPGAVGSHFIKSLNDNVISLGGLYEEGKSRVRTYRDMVDTMADAVRAGKKVVAVYYGHPGVFVTPTHQVIALLKEEGYQAWMEPGISAEDCLVADLGIDPGTTGCQAMEATQFLFYRHTINPHNLLLLWQVCLAGDHRMKSLDERQCQHGLQVLCKRLMEFYPADHEVILYEAATLAVCKPRIERMPLSALPDCEPSLISTLVIPSLGMPGFDTETLAELGLDADQVIEQMTNV